jgi:hypothetical protein
LPAVSTAANGSVRHEPATPESVKTTSAGGVTCPPALPVGWTSVIRRRSRDDLAVGAINVVLREIGSRFGVHRSVTARSPPMTRVKRACAAVLRPAARRARSTG